MSNKVAVCSIFFLFGVYARAYYIVEPVSDRFEQSSKDLDLSFFAGNPAKNDIPPFIKPPIKKVYEYRNSENPNIELGFDSTNGLYEIVEIPQPRSKWAETSAVPERNRKLVKLNNGRKGEIILELRVTANNDMV